MSNDDLCIVMSTHGHYGVSAALEATTTGLLEHLMSTRTELLTPTVPLGMPLEVFHHLLAERNAYLGAIEALKAQQPHRHELAIQVKPSPLGLLRRTLRQLRGK